MRCKDLQDRISSYVEDEQDEAVRRMMDAHLAVCPDCAEALSGVRKVRAGLNRLEHLQPSPDFTFALRGRLLMDAGSRSFGSRAMAWLFPTAPRTVLSGALVAVGVVILAFVFRDPRSTLFKESPQQGLQRPPAAFSQEDLPSHYVLERIPAISHRSLTISSQYYAARSARGDSLVPPYQPKAAQVQYVRF